MSVNYHTTKRERASYAPNQAEPYSYMEFCKRHPNNDVFLEKLWKLHYGTLKQCPKCNLSTKFNRVKNRKTYQCGCCQYNIAPLANTIFHKSSTPLTKWFYALYLFFIHHNRLTAKELEQKLEVTYKTAWRMLKLIKTLNFQENRHIYFQLL